MLSWLPGQQRAMGFEEARGKGEGGSILNRSFLLPVTTPKAAWHYLHDPRSGPEIPITLWGRREANGYDLKRNGDRGEESHGPLAVTPPKSGRGVPTVMKLCHDVHAPRAQGFVRLRNRHCQLHIQFNCSPTLWIASVVNFHPTQGLEETVNSKVGTALCSSQAKWQR